MAKFVQTAVLAAGTLLAFCRTPEELAAFDGRDDVTRVTKKDYKPEEGQPSWDELSGKAKPADTNSAPKAARNTTPLEGAYHVVKDFPVTADDHPKKPIWNAIAGNTTVEAAKAACPAENPKRKTKGTYTFASEFRYFLKTGYVALGEAPAAELKQAA